MDKFSLKIKPVYSLMADEAESSKFTNAMKLMRHQLDTLKAYLDPEIDIIFNVAMTGDGKTLAAYLPAILQGYQAIAAYPTNELIRDQKRSLEEKLAQFNTKLKLDEMNSTQISQLMEANAETNRAEQVKRLLGNTEVILTNPDLFHLLASYNYGWNQRRELVERIQGFFDYYIFDEFHIFGPPQVIAIMNIINAIATERRDKPQSYRRKFIFLSATPNPLMEQMLVRSGLRYIKIEGSYSENELVNTRRILAPCTVNFVPVSADSKGEHWIVNHVEEIINFYRTYPGSKGAIIVNSVATARRLVKLLTPLLAVAGLKVGENTGLTAKSEREASFAADLLIGTSTVDIGVDFQINLLLFEANSSADFLQRFGRLGRHAGYTKDGKTIEFASNSYLAYALCPRFVCERIAEAVGVIGKGDTPPTFDPTTPLARPWFSQEVIAEAFPDRQSFKSYAKRWGLLQAAPFIINLEGKKFEADNYQELRTELVQQFAASFAAKEQQVKAAAICFKKWRDEEDGKTLLAEINSFRGNTLGCGVWDETDNSLKTYSLLYILANSRFALLSEAEFMAEVKRRNLAEYNYRYQMLYLRIFEYLTEADNFGFSLPNLKLQNMPERLNRAGVLKGFKLTSLPRYNIGEINDILKKQKLVCTITKEWGKPADLKKFLNLPSMFPVHSLSDNYGSGYCVAFGKEALLLDSLLWWRKNQSDPQAFFDFEIC